MSIGCGKRAAAGITEGKLGNICYYRQSREEIIDLVASVCPICHGQGWDRSSMSGSNVWHLVMILGARPACRVQQEAIALKVRARDDHYQYKVFVCVTQWTDNGHVLLET